MGSNGKKYGAFIEIYVGDEAVKMELMEINKIEMEDIKVRVYSVGCKPRGENPCLLGYIAWKGVLNEVWIDRERRVTIIPIPGTVITLKELMEAMREW